MEIIYSQTTFKELEILSCRGKRHFGKHLHDGYVLWLNSESAEHFRLKGCGKILQPGTISIIAPGTIHENFPYDPQRRHLRSFYFSEKFLNYIALQVTGQEIVNFSLATMTIMDQRLWENFVKLHDLLLFSDDSLNREVETISVYAALFERLGRQHLKDDRIHSSGKRLGNVIDFIKASLGNTMTLDELAKIAGCTSHHLIRLFGQQEGVSPHAYITQLRLEYARNLLDEHSSIASAACKAGFADQSHLTRNFKKRYGIPPGVYISQKNKKRSLLN